jgi:hypothetical protein
MYTEAAGGCFQKLERELLPQGKVGGRPLWSKLISGREEELVTVPPFFEI